VISFWQQRPLDNLKKEVKMTRKKKLLSSLTILLVMSLVSVGCPPPVVEPPAVVPPPPVIELKFASFWPPVHPQVVCKIGGHEAWIEAIEKATGGRVNITLYPGGVLLKSAEMYAGVVAGIADIGAAAYDYTPRKFPLMEVFGLPGWHAPHALASTLTAHRALERLRPYAEEIADVKVLMHWTAGDSNFVSTRPIRTLADLEGMTVRALGATGPTVAALGTIPVAMPMPDVYHALEVGIIDAYVGPASVIPGFKLYEAAHYITPAPFVYNLVFFKVMNLDVWNALPEDIQKIFEMVSLAWVIRYGELRSRIDEIGLEVGLKHGMELIHLSPECMARGWELVEPLREAWVAEMEAKGLPGRKFLDVVIELDAFHAGR
jgi:TRAP-type C4-dicarboxylate transport system substrate-binding protein